MAVYQIETRAGKTKFGSLLTEKEIIPDLKKRFPGTQKTEKEILEILKADREIQVTEIDTSKPETLEKPQTEARQKRTRGE